MGDLPTGGNPPQKSTSLFLQIVDKEDGSITRPFVPLSPPSGDNQDDLSVHSRDVPLNPAKKTWLRIYRPNLPSPPPKKLPLILFFHGGGFVVFNASSIFYHQFTEELAKALPALVISLDYRLAPENRLPAAYEDAIEAVLWVRAQALCPDPATCGDPWLTSHADFSSCFLMGSSSGGNMAYHAGLKALALELEPIRLVGVILHQPYFGGVERTLSEKASEDDAVLPLRANDNLWRLALPKGADRDHQFCNPVAAPPDCLRRLPKCLVTGCEGDPLVDRQREFVKMMEAAGAKVMARLDDKGFHAMELFDPVKAQALFDDTRHFVYSTDL